MGLIHSSTHTIDLSSSSDGSKQACTRNYRDVLLRPSLLAITLKLTPALVVLIAAYLLIGSVGNFLFPNNFEQVHHIQYLWYCLLRVGIVVEIVRRYYNHVYIFGKHGLIHRAGRCSPRMGTIRIKYSDIREIRVEQSLLGRLFDYGALRIGTASTSGYEGDFKDISHPKSVAAWIQSEKIERQIGKLKKSDD